MEEKTGKMESIMGALWIPDVVRAVDELFFR